MDSAYNFACCHASKRVDVRPPTVRASNRSARAGEGEFGIVYKAMWHGTAVAAKILKNTSAIALGDFRSEIEVLRKVHHPNAVQFLGARPGTLGNAPHVLLILQVLGTWAGIPAVPMGCYLLKVVLVVHGA